VPGAHQARAEAPYPTRPVRIILPNAVGGVADTTVRVIAEKLGDKLGQRFKAGAVLYTGADTLPFGDRLAAVPVSGLWSR